MSEVGWSTGRKPPRRAFRELPAPPKTEKGLRRREELIEATTRAVDKVGYDNLTVALICETASAPIGLYYRYFRNKSDAVLAALERLIDGYSVQVEREEGEGDFFSAQAAGFSLYEKLFSAHPGLLSCFYSYEYGESAFSDYFHDQTLKFDRLHLARTARWLHLNY